MCQRVLWYSFPLSPTSLLHPRERINGCLLSRQAHLFVSVTRPESGLPFLNRVGSKRCKSNEVSEPCLQLSASANESVHVREKWFSREVERRKYWMANLLANRGREADRYTDIDAHWNVDQYLNIYDELKKKVCMYGYKYRTGKVIFFLRTINGYASIKTYTRVKTSPRVIFCREKTNPSHTAYTLEHESGGTKTFTNPFSAPYFRLFPGIEGGQVI